MIKNTIILVLLIIIIGLTFIIASNDKNGTEPQRQAVESEIPEAEESPNVQEDIIGTWVSIQDPKAVVVYKEDGATEDMYDGTTLGVGTWEIYQNNSAEYNPSGYFLRTEVNNETLEYAIISSENNVLQLNYLSRGNTLEYERQE